MDQFPALQNAANLPDIADRQKLFENMAGESFIGYVTLIQGGSDLAKPPHKLPSGEWALMENKQPTKLGEKFDAVILDFRPCCRIVDKRGAGIKITSVYNPEDPRFAEIQTIADQKQDPVHVHYWGFEYLLWIPSLKKFAGFYANNKTARRAAREQIHPLLSNVANGIIKVVEFSSHFIVTTANSWYGPVCAEIEADLEAVPEEAHLQRVWSAFLAAMKSNEVFEETEEPVAAEDNR